MATKNAISPKTKQTSKSKGKAKEGSKEVFKETPISAPAKASKPTKVEKSAKPKAAPQAVESVPTPKIMTAKGKEPKKKAPVTVVSPEDKIDPEWTQLMNQNKATKPVPYSMSEDFQPKTMISHKVLGLGFVLKSQNNRIEVCFKEGKKTLITNYKK